MTLYHGDCLDVMAGMDPESVDAVVTDPPYGLEFMGKAWDGADGFRRSLNTADVGRDNVFGRTSATSPEYRTSPMRRRAEHDAVNTGVAKQGGRQRQGADYQRRQARDGRTYQEWTQAWAEVAYRIARPSAYLLAFGGTRTHHRLMAGIEDAGWEIRDCLVWGYANGFPKSKATLKPAWEPIVLARKPGPLRHLDIAGCLIPLAQSEAVGQRDGEATADAVYEGGFAAKPGRRVVASESQEPDVSDGRWPANIVLTDAVLGSGYSRFFLIPKASRADREPVLGGLPLRTGGSMTGPETRPDRPTNHPQRQNVHPTVKPTDLMRHLVRLVTPPGGVVLDPFLGSGTTAIAAEMEGFAWIGIEREAEYVAIAEARLNGTQKGLGLAG